MKIHRALYYILFLLLILGSFASMARNNYGLELVSVSCYLFAASFMVEMLLGSEKKGISQLVEFISAAVLFLLFGFRAAYIYIPYLEWVLMISAVLLIISYGRNAWHRHTEISQQNRFFGLMIWSYYLGVMAFLISIFSRPLVPVLSEMIGISGGGLLGIFILGVIFRRKQLLDGVETNLLSFVRDQKDHSSVLATGFLLMSAYVGMNMLSLLPPLYTDEEPEAYIELVNTAETGGEEAVDGLYRHNFFMDEMDKFLERHGDYYK